MVRMYIVSYLFHCSRVLVGRLPAPEESSRSDDSRLETWQYTVSTRAHTQGTKIR